MTENAMTTPALAEVEAHWVTADISAQDLESPDWHSATPVAIARRWSGEEAPPERHAEARILWTDAALCVRFKCRQTEPIIASSNPFFDQKTIGLWHRDVCEIFVAPDSDAPERYFEFEAAPTAEWIDLAIIFKEGVRETDFEFHSGMTVSASLAGEELTIAMRIPWSSFIPKPKRDDKWRVNLFRCVGIGNERYLAWLPTYSPEPNFHVPAAFGWLSFA